MKPKLFLLRPNFRDQKVSKSQLFYCPHSAMVEGVLMYYPQLKDQIDVEYVSFERPRTSVIELLGEKNQLCPVLILPSNTPNTEKFNEFNNLLFTNDKFEIASYFGKTYNCGTWHP
jgi:hypothetical protein